MAQVAGGARGGPALDDSFRLDCYTVGSHTDGAVRKVKERRTYRVVLNWDVDGKGWNVTVPAIPGCFTWGKSVDEAVANAREAVEVNLEDMVARGEPIPPPDDVRLETVTVEVPA